MRPALVSLLLLAWLGVAVAQDPATNQKPVEGGDDKPAEAKPEEPKEAPAYKLPEKERKKLKSHLQKYLYPPKGKTRQQLRQKFEAFVSKPVGGHSVLEDVDALMELANEAKLASVSKSGRKRTIELVSVSPDVHGFPGGIGTVKYWRYLPKNYSYKVLSPLIFCLPNNKLWSKGSDYIKEMWLRNPSIADKYVIVAPVPPTKGAPWYQPKAYGMAMIALRHAAGNFEQTKKNGGPAVNINRMFIDGGDVAAGVAARFAELWTGAILHDATGSGKGVPNLGSGGLNGIPAYCVCRKGKKQVKFAKRLTAGNVGSTSEVVEADGKKVLGDVKKIRMWMEKQPRISQPRKIAYTIHDPSFQRHFWINVLDYDSSFRGKPSFAAEADRASNIVEIEPRGLLRFEVFLNDAIVDLNKDVTIVIIDGEEEIQFFKGKVERNLALLLDELIESNHPWRVYTARLVIDMPTLRAAQAKRKAAEAAEKKKAADKKKAAEGKDGGKKEEPSGGDTKGAPK
ncbi:MAG: hypothetical protein O7E54_05005 [Planctomycetota bacterium]|nr:hypothetical protein [Planctomycetota bacterium]